jgi:hypothetical protein
VVTLKEHQRMGRGKEVISAQTISKHWKARKADSRQVISHCLK